jgi:competence protein ComGC
MINKIKEYQKSNNYKKYLTILNLIKTIAIFLIIIVLFLFFLFKGNLVKSNKMVPELNGGSDCVLSLCDCQCYPSHLLPELKQNKLCGINCLDLKNISGCIKKNETCLVVVS